MRRFPHAIPAIALAMLAGGTGAQTNVGSLRFHGTGHSQIDRARFAIDDDTNGPDASTPADIGGASFTIEFWVKGTLADNPSPVRAGALPGSFADYDWILGNTILDRDIDGASQRDWGVSIRGGHVEFGTGPGDSAPDPSINTLVGGSNVLTGAWRHVALVRDAATGVKSIYIDGVLDAQSGDVSRADISYPDVGFPGAPTHCSGVAYGPYIVLGAEKHDYDQFEEAGCAIPPPANVQYPSFSGFIDEVRLWNVARTGADIAASRLHVFAAMPSGLVAYWRFEETPASRTDLVDSAGLNSAGVLVGNAAGNGERSTDVPFTVSAVEGWSLY